ncbi:MAG TPA: glycosyltransferase family 39 protein [Anaerolineales bacterium]|nr:glycosyltransferase family 39 protein [Anaerolineales bacterium]
MMALRNFVSGLLKRSLTSRAKAWLRPRLLSMYGVLIGLLSLAGGWLIYYGTALSVWGGADSTEYLVSARNMLRGIGIGYYSPNGLFYWISLHPPFYPIMLGAASLPGLSLMEAARWLNIVLFALTIGLTGLLFWRSSSSPALGVLAGLLIMAFPEMLRMSTAAMSEPLFIFLCSLHGLLLILYFRGGKTRYLVLAAVTAGLSAVTRYTGISLIGAGAVCVFLFSRGKWPGRFKQAAAYFALACVPLAAWFGWSYFGANHSVAGRTSLGVRGMAERLEPFRLKMVSTLWSWMPMQDRLAHVPYRGQLAVLGAVALVVAVLSLLAYRRAVRRAGFQESRGDLYILGIFGSFSLAYIGFLAFTTAFTSLPPDIDDRMLLPLYVSNAIALLAACSFWGQNWLAGRPGWFKLIPWLVGALFLIQYVPESTAFLSNQHVDPGLRAWENSAIVQAVAQLPKDTPVISTRPNILLLWADRPAYPLTVDFSPAFLAQNGPYGSDPQDPLQKLFREKGAALVDFDDLSPQFIQNYGKDSAERLDLIIKGLVVYRQTPEATIYFYPK